VPKPGIAPCLWLCALPGLSFDGPTHRARSPAVAVFRWGCFRSSALPWPPFDGFSLRGEAGIELLERNSGEQAVTGPRFYNRQAGIALIPGCSSAHLRHSRVSSTAFRQFHPKARLSSSGTSPATLTVWKLCVARPGFRPIDPEGRGFPVCPRARVSIHPMSHSSLAAR